MISRTVDSVIIKNGFDRCIQFLNQSNLIEGIKSIDYSKEEMRAYDKGHFGAFILSQQQAIDQAPLTVRHLRKWQELVTREQELEGLTLKEEEIGHIRGPNNQKNVRVGRHIPPSWEHVPLRISHLVEDINTFLSTHREVKDVEYCEFLGSTFQQFEAIHPFSDGNGRVGRLLANYIATYYHRPIMIFQSEMIEKNRYYDAHESKYAMCCFMAKKIKEALFGFFGNLVVMEKKSSGGTIHYKQPEGEEKLIYEWHALNDKFSEPIFPT